MRKRDSFQLVEFVCTEKIISLSVGKVEGQNVGGTVGNDERVELGGRVIGVVVGVLVGMNDGNAVGGKVGIALGLLLGVIVGLELLGVLVGIPVGGEPYVIVGIMLGGLLGASVGSLEDKIGLLVGRGDRVVVGKVE